MSSITIHPSIVRGKLQARASKSCMQRACAAALLKGGTTIIHNYGTSNDDKAAIEIIRQLGAEILCENDTLIIDSRFSVPNKQQSVININCGESGLSLRMFTSIVALLNQQIHIVGEGSLLNRPMDFFALVLPQLNVVVEANNGKLPIIIKGPLKANDITIDGALSSQFLTGLLFAYSFLNSDATILVNDLKSKPYIGLTLQVIQDFGLNVPVNKNYREFVFNKQTINQPNNQAFNYTVEGDWSNAAFLLVAGAIAGSITVSGLNLHSTQGDKAILDVLKLVNCDISIKNDCITVTNVKALQAFNFDATDCPDLFPPLVALASYCDGTSSIIGVNRLTHKESNRAMSLQQEFGKMGVEIGINNDVMLICGNGNIKGALVDSHNDHRIAMACAIAALKANAATTITNAEAINKSYPNFYEKAARRIFGYTPEMIKFFSEKVTGVEYPWVKYAQITGRDYVSGAMENTTATLHQESAQQNLRELVDGNHWEGTIAHELFHQWFGDYVTAESWSNLTVNESFADYSQYLWQEYKYGADAAGEENDNEMQAYIKGNSSKKDLVRFFYRDKEDMFDLVSYQKGGRILNMLRNYVGDSAFFKSLNKYLTDNKFGNGSAHKLRLAFEAVTGKDLNWFFNQWYFNNGHPKLTISNSYDAATKTLSVFVKQTQDSTKIFKLPVAIEVYTGKEKTRHDVWVENRFDTIKIEVAAAPDFVKFDADNVLLAEKKEKKTLNQFIIQYKQAGKYLDRKEALDYASKNRTEAGAMQLIISALKDPYDKLRIKALNTLQDTTVDAETVKTIETIAKTDNKKTVKAEAIDFLGQLRDAKYTKMFIYAAKDSSYSVAGAALEALIEQDAEAALRLVPDLKKDAKGRLKSAVEKAEILTKTDADFDTQFKKYESSGLMEKFNDFGNFAFYIGRLNDTEKFKKGVDQLVKFRDMVAPYGQGIKEMLNKSIMNIKRVKDAQKNKSSNSLDIENQINYILEKTQD